MTETHQHIIRSAALILTAACALGVLADTVEPLPFGDFEQWVTRTVTESTLIGGANKHIYAIGPTQELNGEVPYQSTGKTPWATSNIMAKVSGITKATNSVWPQRRGDSNRCARLSTGLQRIKVLGLINVKVMVAGSIYLGRIIEPVTDTKEPYAKIDMGIPFAGRPQALVLDYMTDVPVADTRQYCPGFGRTKTLRGRDNAVVFVFLQKRWEAPDGSLHALRVGTGGERFGHSTPWVNGHKVPIHYGDVSADKSLGWLGLRQGETAYWAANSHGKIVPVQEEGWASPDETPTHVVLMVSSGNGRAYEGTEGLTICVDNLAWVY